MDIAFQNDPAVGPVVVAGHVVGQHAQLQARGVRAHHDRALRRGEQGAAVLAVNAVRGNLGQVGPAVRAAPGHGPVGDHPSVDAPFSDQLEPAVRALGQHADDLRQFQVFHHRLAGRVGQALEHVFVHLRSAGVRECAGLPAELPPQTAGDLFPAVGVEGFKVLPDDRNALYVTSRLVVALGDEGFLVPDRRKSGLQCRVQFLPFGRQGSVQGRGRPLVKRSARLFLLEDNLLELMLQGQGPQTVIPRENMLPEAMQHFHVLFAVPLHFRGPGFPGVVLFAVLALEHAQPMPPGFQGMGAAELGRKTTGFLAQPFEVQLFEISPDQPGGCQGVEERRQGRVRMEFGNGRNVEAQAVVRHQQGGTVQQGQAFADPARPEGVTLAVRQGQGANAVNDGAVVQQAIGFNVEEQGGQGGIVEVGGDRRAGEGVEDVSGGRVCHKSHSFQKSFSFGCVSSGCSCSFPKPYSSPSQGSRRPVSGA